MVFSYRLLLLMTIGPLVVAMVDFAISAQFGLIYSKKLLAAKPIFSHSFGCRAFKFEHKLLYGHLVLACGFSDDRTIVVAMVDFVISAQFGLIYSKNYLLLILSPPQFLS